MPLDEEKEDLLNPKPRFAPSLIRELANSAMGRVDVLPLWLGKSVQPTPAFIRAVAIASLQAGETFYSEVRPPVLSAKRSPLI